MLRYVMLRYVMLCYVIRAGNLCTGMLEERVDESRSKSMWRWRWIAMHIMRCGKFVRETVIWVKNLMGIEKKMSSVENWSGNGTKVKSKSRTHFAEPNPIVACIEKTAFAHYIRI